VLQAAARSVALSLCALALSSEASQFCSTNYWGDGICQICCYPNLTDANCFFQSCTNGPVSGMLSGVVWNVAATGTLGSARLDTGDVCKAVIMNTSSNALPVGIVETDPTNGLLANVRYIAGTMAGWLANGSNEMSQAIRSTAHVAMTNWAKDWVNNQLNGAGATATNVLNPQGLFGYDANHLINGGSETIETYFLRDTMTVPVTEMMSATDEARRELTDNGWFDVVGNGFFKLSLITACAMVMATLFWVLRWVWTPIDTTSTTWIPVISLGGTKANMAVAIIFSVGLFTEAMAFMAPIIGGFVVPGWYHFWQNILGGATGAFAPIATAIVHAVDNSFGIGKCVFEIALGVFNSFKLFMIGLALWIARQHVIIPHDKAFKDRLLD